MIIVKMLKQLLSSSKKWSWATSYTTWLSMGNLQTNATIDARRLETRLQTMLPEYLCVWRPEVTKLVRS